MFMNVGVMKDEKLKMRNLHTSHTLFVRSIITQPQWTSHKRNSVSTESLQWNFVYYESRKRDLKTRPIYECRCDERLKTKSEKSTRLTYTGLIGELEHLEIKTRLIDKMFQVCGYFNETGRSPPVGTGIFFYYYYYESRKWEVKTRLIYEDRCDERLKN